MAIEHWVTLVPDTKTLEKGIKKALAPVEKPVEVEVTADKGKAEKSGRGAGKAIDKGAQDATKNTGEEVGKSVDKGAKDATKDTGKDVGKSVDKGAKDGTRTTGKDVGTKIGKDLGDEATKSGKSAGAALGTAISGALGSMVRRNISSVLSKVISGDIQGAARDVSSALDGISGGLANIQNITGSDNFIGRGLGRLRDVVDNASSSVEGLTGTISAVSSGVSAVNDTTDAAMQMVDAFTTAKDGISSVRDLLGQLEKRAPAIAAALGKIAGPMIEIAGAAAAVGWVQDRLPESLQGREPTIDKDLGPNQGKGLSGRNWGHDFTHPWEIPQRIWRNFFGGDSEDEPSADVGDSISDTVRRATGNDPIDLPGGLAGDIRGALSDAKQNEKDRRESERAAKAAQREAEREAKAAQREADRAAREAARAGGGGGRGPASTGTVGAPARGVGAAMGGNLAAMMALAQSASGRTKYGPASDLAGGLADCSGAISDLVEVLNTGTSSPKRLFTTVDFATDEQAAKFGFLPGYMPGALNIGVTPLPGQSGHMAATLPNGVNFESGGGTGGGAQYGGNAAGALDKQFTKRYYRPVDGSGVGAFGGGGSVNPSSMPGFYAWVVPMRGDGAAAAGGPGGPGGGAPIGGGISGGAGGSDVFSQLRSIGEGGAKETFLPDGFSDPTSWPNVQSGMALLKVFGGMLGGNGQQGLIGDTRHLAPGELNPAITAGGSASLLGGAAGMMTQLTQGGVAAPHAGGGATVDQSINFNGNVDGDVSKGLAKANTARVARTRVTTGPMPI